MFLSDAEAFVRCQGIFESENFNPVRFVNEDRDYERNRKSVFLNLGAEYLFDDNTSHQYM